MPGHLETQIGELAGQLKSLVPTLSNLEGRMDETRDIAIQTRTEQANLEKELKRISNFLGEKPSKGDIDNQKSDIENLQSAKSVKERKLWDVVKIILGIIVPAAIGALGAILAK